MHRARALESASGLPCRQAEEGSAESAECSAGPCLPGSVLTGLLFALLAAVALSLLGYIAWGKVQRRRVVPKIMDEEAEEPGGIDLAAWLASVPSYWSNKEHGEATNFHELVYVNSAQFPKFDELLRTTYRPVCSQDRPCPKGTCPKTHFGCPWGIAGSP